MRRGWCVRIVPLYLAFFYAPFAMAGALAPCLKAGISADGSYLVIREFQLEPGSKETPGEPLKIQKVIYRIYPKEEFINEKDRLVSQAKFWHELAGEWSVVLDLHKLPSMWSCPYFLITNDGEFMVFFGSYIGDHGLRIYRRRDHIGGPIRQGPDHGVFIREVPVRELWPPEAYDRWSKGIFTDHSTQWLAGGSFEFTADSRQLLYKTRWGNTVSVRLVDGSVSERR